MNEGLSGICKIQENVASQRISSYDRSGNNRDYIVIGKGETAEIADISGAGIIKHIWITFASQDAFIRRNAVIRMYWDDEKHPSVEAPIGDFFGQGWGEEYNLSALPVGAAPARGKALYCYFPMPFSDRARITIDNQSAYDIDHFFYYIDYEAHASMSISMGRFHAQWKRELTEAHPEEGETEWGTFGPYGNNTTGHNNYVFADIEGKGHFVGLHYYVDNPGPMWYGEGDDMWFIDGERWPCSLHGTGTEDLFNTAWCPNERFLHPYFGIAKVPDQLGFMGRTHNYRFFLQDPIHFSQSLKGSIEHGHNNCLTLDICTVAYWYQLEPHKVFPPLPNKELRENMPTIGLREVHLWRHEWRRSMGGGKRLWGNEEK